VTLSVNDNAQDLVLTGSELPCPMSQAMFDFQSGQNCAYRGLVDVLAEELDLRERHWA